MRMSKYVEMTQRISNNDSIWFNHTSIIRNLFNDDYDNYDKYDKPTVYIVYICLHANHGTSWIFMDHHWSLCDSLFWDLSHQRSSGCWRRIEGLCVMACHDLTKMDPTYPMNSLFRFIVLFLLQIYYKKLERYTETPTAEMPIYANWGWLFQFCRLGTWIVLKKRQSTNLRLAHNLVVAPFASCCQSLAGTGFAGGIGHSDKWKLDRKWDIRTWYNMNATWIIDLRRRTSELPVAAIGSKISRESRACQQRHVFSDRTEGLHFPSFSPI